ncbi:MAG: methyltransferase [Ruthenibacterium lactatiformans]
MADLCSGTGAIALGVATHVPGARVTAVELSPDALAYLRANNAACGCPLCVVQADVLRWQEECAPGSFDVIVSNPPYIAPEEMAGLQPELFHEPRMALEAPDGGLAFYKHIAPAYFGALKPGGRRHSGDRLASGGRCVCSVPFCGI